MPARRSVRNHLQGGVGAWGQLWHDRWRRVWTHCWAPGDVLRVFLCHVSLHHWGDWRAVSYCTQVHICTRCAISQVEVQHWWVYTHSEERPGREGGRWGDGAPGGMTYWQCRMCGAIKAERGR